MHFPMSISQIELLNGSNFRKWKTDIELNLGILDYDHVLKEDPPEELTQTASREAKEKYEKWYKHNKMALIMIKKSMTENMKGSIPESEYAKVFFNSIAEKFKISDKAETNNLMKSLMRMEFNGRGSVREFIMKGSDIAAKLRGLNISVEDSFLVYMLLNKLPDEYDNLKSLYKTQKEQWSVNELISLCVEIEDETKKKGKEIAVNLVTKVQHKKKFGDNYHKGSTSKLTVKHNNHKGKSSKSAIVMQCFFCKRPGHFKKDCEGFKAWLTKKGDFLFKPVFNLETNDFIPDNSWCFDTGSPIHIVNSLQGLSSITIPNKNETKVCTASGQKVAVKAVGIVRLVFRNNYVLELNNVYCIPSISRNLISGSQFVSNNGFKFSSDNKSMLFYYISVCFGQAKLIGGYWFVDCEFVIIHVLFQMKIKVFSC